MHHDHNKLVEKPIESLAKWKREAETWYRQDTAMFEGFFQTVEANVV